MDLIKYIVYLYETIKKYVAILSLKKKRREGGREGGREGRKREGGGEKGESFSK